MQIAVCCPDGEEARRISRIIEQQAAKALIGVQVESFRTEDALWRVFAPGRFAGAVIGFGDVQGFLCARRVRESDRDCRVILLDDTNRYAIRGLRLHLTDFLVRPLEDERFRAAAARLFTE
jgi:DNA-binding LytR/AlgR family response regulator